MFIHFFNKKKKGDDQSAACLVTFNKRKEGTNGSNYDLMSLLGLGSLIGAAAC